jgi:iterative type I PKS product template protein
VIANVLSLKDALILVATRVRLMVQKCSLQSTGMLAVNANSKTITKELRSSTTFAELSIVCFNGPADCVVSGPLEHLQDFKRHLNCEVQCRSSLLMVPFGYHSIAMRPMMDDFSHVAQNVTMDAPTIPVVSTVIGDIVMPTDTMSFDSNYFGRHCSGPVLFERGLNALKFGPESLQVDIWIEISPHTTLLPLIQSIFPEGILLASMRKQQDPWSTLTHSLSQLYQSNIALRWREVFVHLPWVSCTSLPSYPFARTKFWVPYKETFETAHPITDNITMDLVTDYSMLHTWAQYPSRSNGYVAIFETPISKLADAIQGHKVGGLPLCPVSVYLEQILAGVSLVKRNWERTVHEQHVVMKAIEFVNPLVYDAQITRTVKTSITFDDSSGFFSVSSLEYSSTEEVVHVHGSFLLEPIYKTSTEFSQTLPALTRQILSFVEPRGGEQREIFASRTTYEVLFPRVVEYSDAYRTIQSIMVDPNGAEGYATVKLPTTHDHGAYVVHPVFMDSLLHVAGFVVNHQGNANDIFICTEVASVKVVAESVDNDASYGVYCSSSWFRDEGLMVAEAFAVELGDSRKIVAHIEGMQFRRVRLDSLKRRLASSITSLPYQNTAASHSSPLRSLATPPNVAIQETENLITDIETEVFKLVSDTCGFDIATLDRHTDLASLGIDSLLSIELLSGFQDVFPHIEIDSHLFFRCQTLGEITRQIYSSYSPPHLPKSLSGCSGASSPRTLVHDDKLVERSASNAEHDLDVKRVLASVLYVSTKDLDDDIDLEVFGLDSLASAEALHLLQSRLGVKLPHNIFTKCPTVRALRCFLDNHPNDSGNVPHAAKERVIEESSSKSRASPLRPHTLPVPIQQSKDSDSVPLFLIHDGSGLVNYYDRLPPMDRDIWGIYNPQLEVGNSWDSLTSMAIAYARYVLRTTSGPVLLGGSYLASKKFPS